MPLYDFECEPCAYYTEIRQGPEDPDVHECPFCASNTLKKVFINAPSISVIGEPTTVKHLADRNTKKMGRYELESKNAKNNSEQYKEAKKARDQRRKINSMTQEQKIKWIKEGD
jgi:putative FmdB family regulatory protein